MTFFIRYGNKIVRVSLLFIIILLFILLYNIINDVMCIIRDDDSTIRKKKDGGFISVFIMRSAAGKSCHPFFLAMIPTGDFYIRQKILLLNNRLLF